MGKYSHRYCEYYYFCTKQLYQIGNTFYRLLLNANHYYSAKLQEGYCLLPLHGLRDREVACSASDLQGLNFESCVWRAVSSHHPQEVLLAQCSLYVHKCGLKPDSFHFALQNSINLGTDIRQNGWEFFF